MKIQTITLVNNIGTKLELERTITPTEEGIVYGKLWDSGLIGLDFDSRRTLQSLGMRCKYANGTGFEVGKKITLKEHDQVPPIYKNDTDNINDLNCYTVTSIESIAIEDLK